MDKQDYLSHASVQDFIQWCSPIIDTPGTLAHGYTTRKSKTIFRFDSIYDAYQKYSWYCSFTGTDGRHYSGQNREQNETVLDMLSADLRDSVETGNAERCQAACIAIQNWGGTRGNIGRIQKMNEGLVEYLRLMKVYLNPETHQLKKQVYPVHMTSGFSKIYALLIDNFIIYDSRVAAFLCKLVRDYCVSTNLSYVPKPLIFALGASRSEANRDPGCSKYRIPKMNANSQVYLDNNMRANWLLSGLMECRENRFHQLSRNKRLLALSHALFMLGYEVQKGIG